MIVKKDKIEKLARELFPIFRSITGEGVRETLEIISKEIPLEKKFFTSGEKVFDWTVPKEWKFNHAFLKDLEGNVLLDASKNNLNLLNYSQSYKGVIKREDLLNHLYSLESQPNTIPYLTSYYHSNWGFCVTDNFKKSLNNKEYYVDISTDHFVGKLDYAEFYKKGLSDKEIVLSTYTCHPSMYNDNISGILLAILIGKYFENYQLNHSLRILFVPETIGVISWLSRNFENFK